MGGATTRSSILTTTELMTTEISNVRVFSYDGASIEFEVINGQVYANATAMCKPFNKRPNDWYNLQTTQRYFAAITSKSGNSDYQLVINKPGSPEYGGGTWIHEKLILKLAQWLDVYFEVWCDECITQVLRATNPKLSLPQTYLEALKQLTLEVESKERIQRELDIALPKAEFYDAVTGSSDTIDLGTAAKTLNMPGIGRTKLFNQLREWGVLMSNNKPYQTYCDRGWFRVIETSYSKPDGSQHVYFKTVVFQSGIDGIRKMFNKKASLVSL